MNDNLVTIGDATLYHADAVEGLQSLPDASVQCVVTSPPYWGLRDYGVEGMIGLEPTFDEFLTKMVSVFSEIRRVLRKDGTVWLNMGDAYAGGGRGSYYGDDSKQATNFGSTNTRLKDDCFRTPQGFKPKDLLMMPARLAIALQADGWWLRSEIIWAKPNPMPESCKDRPTSSHEKIYLLTKSARYFYDADAVMERTGREASPEIYANADGRKHFHNDDLKAGMSQTNPNYKTFTHPSGRNLRNVWAIATQPYPEAHFATFPEALPMKCIMAGTKDGDTVLDPFSGSATTGLVALKLGRKYIGIELNEEYIKLSIKRLTKEASQVKLFTGGQR